ncbi:MAG: T9SS type A sorting domain-containing protein [Bacteroidales bacterium]
MNHFIQFYKLIVVLLFVFITPAISLPGQNLSYKVTANDLDKTSGIKAVDNIQENDITQGIRSLFDTVYYDYSSGDNGYCYLTVSFYSLAAVNSLDFSIKLNTLHLRYDSLTVLVSYLDGAVGFYNESDSTFRFTSFSLQNFSVSVPLITLRFIAVSTVGEDDFSQVRSYLNGDEVASKLRFGVSGISENEYLNFNVFPNPTSDYLGLRIDQVAVASITDIKSKAVLGPFLLSPGVNTLDIQNLVPGIYILRLISNKKSGFKKIIVQ